MHIFGTELKSKQATQRKSTSKVKEKKGTQTRQFLVDVAAKATVVSWFSAVVSLLLLC